MNPVTIEGGYPLWEDNRVHCSCQVWSRQTYLWMMYWCRIPNYSSSRTILHDKGHWRVLTIHRISAMSWVHFAKRWKIIWPERLDSGNTKIGPVWKLQPVACKVSMEWKSEVSVETKTILTRGSEFLWLEKGGHGLKQQQGGRQQRAGNLWNAVRRTCVKIECKCFCEPIKD